MGSFCYKGGGWYCFSGRAVAKCLADEFEPRNRKFDAGPFDLLKIPRGETAAQTFD